jgi:YHS domain-containing protein
MLGWMLRLLLLFLVLRAIWQLLAGVFEGMQPQSSRVGAREKAAALVRDPVCGTYLAPAQALTLQASGETRYFCSEECRAAFRKRA